MSTPRSIFRPFTTGPRRSENVAAATTAPSDEIITPITKGRGLPRRNPITPQPSSKFYTPIPRRNLSFRYDDEEETSDTEKDPRYQSHHSKTAPRPTRPICTERSVLGTPPKSFRLIEKNEPFTVPTEIYTPTSKEDNDRWLQSLGIDLSILKMAKLNVDDDNTDDLKSTSHDTKLTKDISNENCDPNLQTYDIQTVVKAAEKSPVTKFTMKKEIIENAVQWDSHDMKSENMVSLQLSDNEVTERPPVSRVSWAFDKVPASPAARGKLRTPRRQSRAISSRELCRLKEEKEVKKEPVSDDDSKSSESPEVEKKGDREKSEATSTGAGSEVFLTPMRASRKQRATLGTDVVVTPVRRSLRLCKKLNQPLVPFDAVDGRKRLLEDADYAYTPNKNII